MSCAGGKHGVLVLLLHSWATHVRALVLPRRREQLPKHVIGGYREAKVYKVFGCIVIEELLFVYTISPLYYDATFLALRTTRPVDYLCQ